MQALVIDDDASLRDVFMRFLTHWGWESRGSHTASEALDLFDREPYDLALCDVDLPDADGIALAGTLVRSRPTLKVIIVSGSLDNIERARAAGFICLQKPFDLNMLKGLLPKAGNTTKDPA